MASKYDKNAIITLLVADNPKRAGSRAHARFALYKNGMTVPDYMVAGGTTRDLAHDIKAGFISVELKTA